ISIETWERRKIAVDRERKNPGKLMLIPLATRSLDRPEARDAQESRWLPGRAGPWPGPPRQERMDRAAWPGRRCRQAQDWQEEREAILPPSRDRAASRLLPSRPAKSLCAWLPAPRGFRARATFC